MLSSTLMPFLNTQLLPVGFLTCGNSGRSSGQGLGWLLLEQPLMMVRGNLVSQEVTHKWQWIPVLAVTSTEMWRCREYQIFLAVCANLNLAKGSESSCHWNRVKTDRNPRETPEHWICHSSCCSCCSWGRKDALCPCCSCHSIGASCPPLAAASRAFQIIWDN